ncbi:MAG: FAD-binding protein [Acidaminococcaceae bacterium]|nr:FAD-binding protein [Acidaminococcaceae bacterium]
MKLLVRNLRISLLKEMPLERALEKKLDVAETALQNIKIVRKAVDARKKENIFLNFHVQVELDAPKKILQRLLENKDVEQIKSEPPVEPKFGAEKLTAPPLIIGAGPAGLYAALELAQYGYKPILVERGKPVAERVRDVEVFWETGDFNPASNCQFGEGGAGTFSDGKLTTRVNDPVMGSILQTFVNCGAPENILYEHKPHVGTDRLRSMVANLSQKIRDFGGQVLYNSQVTGFEVEGNTLTKVVLNNSEKFAVGAVILACGHSARDTYEVLHNMGVAMETKNFAIGLRIEHPQDLIDKAQYGSFAGHHLLGAADYMLTYNDDNLKRSCYSFCMCPGGQVVAAASEQGGVVVNGMSNFHRDSGVANAALVVNVTGDDFGHNPLDGVQFQRKYEQLAFQLGGKNYCAPAQNLDTFLRGAEPSVDGLLSPSYRPGVVASRLSEALPDYVVKTLRLAINNFDRKIKGFGDGGALLTGVETRTSAPLRILRNRENYVSISHANLYPSGEGAGYAGGIMSAALDGYHVARAVMGRYAVNE